MPWVVLILIIGFCSIQYSLAADQPPNACQKYEEAGRNIAQQQQHYEEVIPPHYQAQIDIRTMNKVRFKHRVTVDWPNGRSFRCETDKLEHRVMTFNFSRDVAPQTVRFSVEWFNENAWHGVPCPSTSTPTDPEWESTSLLRCGDVTVLFQTAPQEVRDGTKTQGAGYATVYVTRIDVASLTEGITHAFDKKDEVL